ncbi:conserved hypothetical protein, partial [Ricinus communis]
TRLAFLPCVTTSSEAHAQPSVCRAYRHHHRHLRRHHLLRHRRLQRPRHECDHSRHSCRGV